MHRKESVFLIVVIIIINSCAGMGIRPDAQSEFELGLALFNRGNYEQALPHFQRATELDPNFARAYLFLGRSYLNVHRWLEAVPPLRTAYRLAPSETRKEAFNVLLDALFGAALSELKKGNFQTSISFLREVLQLEPQSQKALNELVGALMAFGGALLSEGKAAEAISIFTEAVELAPKNLDAYLGLAKAFFRSGEILQALRTVKDALTIDPMSKEAQSLFQKLQER